MDKHECHELSDGVEKGFSTQVCQTADGGGSLHTCGGSAEAHLERENCGRGELECE